MSNNDYDTLGLILWLLVIGALVLISVFDPRRDPARETILSRLRRCYWRRKLSRKRSTETRPPARMVDPTRMVDPADSLYSCQLGARWTPGDGGARQWQEQAEMLDQDTDG